MAGNSYRPPGDIEWLFTLSHDISFPTNGSLTMDCPRCRHWVPDRANFCQTCSYQFPVVVKAKRARLTVILFLLGVFAVIGSYSLLRHELNSGSTRGNRSRADGGLRVPSAQGARY